MVSGQPELLPQKLLKSKAARVLSVHNELILHWLRIELIG